MAPSGLPLPYFNDFRWQRQPAESMAFGRVFRIKERAQLQIRAEFQNIFNRLFYQAPADGAPFGFPFTSVATPTAPRQPRRHIVSGLRLCELGKWRPAVIWRGPAQVGPARGAVHVLTSDGRRRITSSAPRAFLCGAK